MVVKNQKMKISLIIAAYNVESFIEKCILSCLHQDLSNDSFEVIVVDDGSTDDTALILEKSKSDFSNLKIIKQKNSGLGATRNTGLLEAKGEYVWFIDGDDYIKENCLIQITNFLNDRNLDCCVLDYNVVSNKNITQNSLFQESLENKNEIFTGENYYYKYYEKNYTWIFIFKKSIFIDNRIYFRERINMQDSEILPKLMYNIKRLSFLHKNLYYYVQHPNSFTNSTDNIKRLNYFNSIIQVKKSLEIQSIDLKNQQKLNIGIQKKIESLHTIILFHLTFFKYDNKMMQRIIKLLKSNDSYPLKATINGKMKFVQIALNINPFVTNWLIQIIRK